jgi:hypothetical protein
MALADTVASLITRLGVNYTFIAGPTASTYDPGTGDHHDNLTEYTGIKGSPPMAFETYYIDNDVVQRDDLLIYVAASGLAFTPQEGMAVTGADLPGRMLVQRARNFRDKDGGVAYAVHLRR